MVITRRTRNPLAFRGPWVRIPPAPPSKSSLPFSAKSFFAWTALPSEAPSSALRSGTPPQNITGSSGNAITNSRVTTNAKGLIWMRKLSRHGLRRRFRCLRPFNCLCFTGSRQNRYVEYNKHITSNDYMVSSVHRDASAERSATTSLPRVVDTIPLLRKSVSSRVIWTRLMPRISAISSCVISMTKPELEG